MGVLIWVMLLVQRSASWSVLVYLYHSMQKGFGKKIKLALSANGSLGHMEVDGLTCGSGTAGHGKNGICRVGTVLQVLTATNVLLVLITYVSFQIISQIVYYRFFSPIKDFPGPF